MEPLNRLAFAPKESRWEIEETFQYEERREIIFWNRKNRKILKDIKADINYVYRGQFVQTERRKVTQTLVKTLDKSAQPKRKKTRGLTINELRRRNEQGSQAPLDDNNKEPEETNDHETISQVSPLTFVGLHTRYQYDLEGNITTTSVRKVVNVMLSESESEPSETSDDDQLEDPQTRKRPHRDLERAERKRKRRDIELARQFRQKLRPDRPMVHKKRTYLAQLSTEYRQTLAGFEDFPQPLKIGKVRRESPRVRLLLTNLSPTTQNFLSKTPNKDKDIQNANPGGSDEKDVSVRFYDYSKYHSNTSYKTTAPQTSKSMVINILYRSFFEKKYELARQALGVYARIPDADFRYVYLMALKLIQERIKDREENSGSNKMLASGYDLHEIEKDEELIRWMCVGYPYIIERMRPNEHRYTHKTAHFNVFYAITLLKKPWPSGYTEALDLLNDLMVKPPYVNEPIFYILRAAANTILAYDKNEMRQHTSHDRIQEARNRRIRAIDQVHEDLERMVQLGGETFYPKSVIDEQLKGLDDLHDLLRDGGDIVSSDENGDSSTDSENEEEAASPESNHEEHSILEPSNGNEPSPSDDDFNSNSKSPKPESPKLSNHLGTSPSNLKIKSEDDLNPNSDSDSDPNSNSNLQSQKPSESANSDTDSGSTTDFGQSSDEN